MAKERKGTFECRITDRHNGDSFTADVAIAKKIVIERSYIDEREIELANIYITPKVRPLAKDVHHHFVVFDMTGRGKYINRTETGALRFKRYGSIWDLGPSFALAVARKLATME